MSLSKNSKITYNKEINLKYSIASIASMPYDYDPNETTIEVLPNDNLLIDSAYVCDIKNKTVIKPLDGITTIFNDYIINKDGIIFDKNGKKIEEHTKSLSDAKINLYKIVNLGENKFLSIKQEKDHFTLRLNDISKKLFDVKITNDIKTAHFNYSIKDITKLPSGRIACLCGRSKLLKGAKDNHVLHLFDVIETSNNLISLKHLGYVFPGKDFGSSILLGGRDVIEIRNESEYSVIWENYVFNLNSLFKLKKDYKNVTDKNKWIMLPDFQHYLSYKKYDESLFLGDVKTNSLLPLQFSNQTIKNIEVLSNGKVVVLTKQESPLKYQISSLDFSFIEDLRKNSYQMLVPHLTFIPNEILKIISQYGWNRFPERIVPHIPELKDGVGGKIKNGIFKGLAKGISLFKPTTGDEVNLALRQAPRTVAQTTAEAAALVVLAPFIIFSGPRHC